MGMGPGAGLASELLEAAVKNPEAAAYWLMVYMTYFRNVVAAAAAHLYRSVGLRAGMMQLGNMVEEAIYKSFHVQEAAARARGARLETLDDLFEQNRVCHHDAAAKLSPLGIEVFDMGRDEQGRYYMETGECNLFKLVDEVPIVRVFPVALVSGLIRGLGYRSRWLTSPGEKRRLCQSIAGATRRGMTTWSTSTSR